MINWEIKHYKDLSVDEFHDLVSLRIEVFVVEQDCPYQDLDGKDKIAFHQIGRDDSGEIVATSRILGPGVSYQEVSIGRVVVSQKVRGRGVAHEMMEKSKEFVNSEYGNVPIRISAQEYLEKYYSGHGFEFTGKKYLEDGIPHMEMLFQPKN
ncbi:MAG: GNAT family N-acetyltransferase [Crocinitomicaceae bacterium]|nr:GNAT family N-acetyltransferase [Crocinitomicaceae bacterium]